MRKGFTLIELLIVVAVIAILAAVAIPNFLLAQVRAKVGRCYADMRSIVMALEAYRVDQAQYPVAVDFTSGTILPHLDRLKPLTTPVSYISRTPSDVFRPSVAYSYLEKYGWEQTSHYFGEPPPVGGLNIRFFEHHEWVLASVGPTIGRPNLADGYGEEDRYDPTNGAVSLGSPIMVGP